MQRRHRSRRLGLETMARGSRTAADAIHVPRVEALGARLIPLRADARLLCCGAVAGLCPGAW